MARKTKYTPDVVKKLTDAIRLGATYELACGYAGISPAIFYRWMNDKVEFVETIKDAEGKAVAGWLAKIEKAANDGAWQAAAWKLERRYPRQYGRLVTEVQGSLDVNYTDLSVTDIDAEIMAIINRRGKGAPGRTRNGAKAQVGSEGEAQPD